MRSADSSNRSRPISTWRSWAGGRSTPSSSAPRSSSGPAPASMSSRAWTMGGSWPSGSGTSWPRHSTPSSPARRASTGSWRRWPPSTTTRARAPAAGGIRPAGPSHGDDPLAARMTATRSPRTQGKVRAARLTDLAALGELSRLCQSDDAATRSLGLPVSGPPIGVFSLFRLPLGAFRPNDLMYVYEGEGRIAGLVRVERESIRDEWTIVELDAVGIADAGDIRYRLVQQILREGAKRGAARFHVACADVDGNVELLMQAGFMRYGEERVMFRPPKARLPAAWTEEAAAKAGIRPVQSIDALALHRLYLAATP